MAIGCVGKLDDSSVGLAAPTTAPHCDANPYGACYPSGTGTAALVIDGAGNVVSRGDSIPNFKLLGFRALDAAHVVDDTAPAGVVALSDFYDPEQKLGPTGSGITVIHVMENPLWCAPSNTEADFVSGADFTGQNTAGVSWARELEPLGVVFIEAIVNGQVPESPATVADLQTWVSRHAVDYTVLLDSSGLLGGSDLGELFTAAEVPMGIDIDARTMEVLDVEGGFNSQLDLTLESWVDWVHTHAPK